jgi:hypothetical protein
VTRRVTRPAISSRVADGDWRLVACLAGGALTCGFFWEFWNSRASPKWIYHVPGMDAVKVFEMPVLGYLGYLPFGLELYALYHFLAGIQSLVNWYGANSNAFLEAQWYMFAGMVMFGAAWTLKVNEHVRVDLFYGWVGDRMRIWIDLLGGIFFLLPMCAIMMARVRLGQSPVEVAPLGVGCWAWGDQEYWRYGLDHGPR